MSLKIISLKDQTGHEYNLYHRDMYFLQAYKTQRGFIGEI